MTWQANQVQERVIVALDVPTSVAALDLVRRLSPHPGLFKIGLQLYTVAGPDIVRAVRDRGGRVFPRSQTARHPEHRWPRGGKRELVRRGDAHPSSQRRSSDDRGRCPRCDAGVVAPRVTILTSVDEATLHEVGVGSSVADQVLKLANLGVESGIRGLVASAKELLPLRAAFGSGIRIVTPGIRPIGAEPNDQRRTLSAADALKAGTDFLVIGRPITGADDPRVALEQIIADAV
jgi:orotidine-5'-phosphate decarboxylase